MIICKMRIFNRFSLITLIVICGFISIYRINTVHENEISWDVLGYYLYLPATFVHHDPLLKDISWLEKINSERKLAGTLYMVSQNKQGEPMYFFLMGMSLFYFLFFLAGNIFSSLLGYPMDGFSFPYQYCLVIGGIIYTIIGLIFLRKIRRFTIFNLLASQYFLRVTLLLLKVTWMLLLWLNME